MTDRELDGMIDWCRKKLANEKHNPFGMTGKRLEGYEYAMLSVMSYLHSKKGKTDNETQIQYTSESRGKLRTSNT